MSSVNVITPEKLSRLIGTPKCPALLVPYPHAAEDHQRKNAQVFTARGAATIVEDSELDADTLYWALLDIMNDDKRATMAAAPITALRWPTSSTR